MKVHIRLKQDLTQFGIYLLIFSLFLILVCEPFGLSSILSLGVWIAFISTILVLIVSIVEGRIYKSPITVFTVLVLIISVFSIIISNQLSYKSIVSLLSFLEIPLFILSLNTISSVKIEKIIYKSFIVISIFLIILSFLPVAHIFENIYGVSYLDFLTLGYGNPNKTGMILFGCFAVLISYINYETKTIRKIFVLADAVYISLMIFWTQSRASIVITVLLIIFSFISNKKIIRIICNICYIAPIVFAPIFIFFPKQLMQSYFLGETLDTGRLSIYLNVFNNMNIKNFLIGNFEYQFKNLHNLYISVFATIGLLGVILFALLYFNILRKMSYSYQSKSSKIALLAFSLFLLHSSAEAAMFLSGSSYAAIIILLYILSINGCNDNYHQRRLNNND